MITGLVSITNHETPITPFDLHAHARQKPLADVVIDFMVYAKAMMIHERRDNLHLRLMENCLRDLLFDMQRHRYIHDVSLCVFKDYTFRDRPKGGARVIYTGRDCIGNRKLSTHYDFSFKGQLLPVWAKQQIRDGLCMVSFQQGLLLHETNLVFHLI